MYKTYTQIEAWSFVIAFFQFFYESKLQYLKKESIIRIQIIATNAQVVFHNNSSKIHNRDHKVLLEKTC